MANQERSENWLGLKWARNDGWPLFRPGTGDGQLFGMIIIIVIIIIVIIIIVIIIAVDNAVITQSILRHGNRI